MGVPWLEASRPGVWWLTGDVFEQLARLPENSIDLVVTSPPFLALRSYLPADHEHKAKEIGSEASPGVFIDTLLDVVEALAPKLTRTASLVFELGDTYSGSTADGGDNRGNDRYPDGRSFVQVTRDRRSGWPLDKSLTLIPQSFALALAYGRNPFNGRETERWRIRNVVAWARPNPPVGALADKFRPATSYLTVATKARDRWFDGDAVRSVNHPERMDERAMKNRAAMEAGTEEQFGMANGRGDGDWNPAGAPLLDYWEIPTQPYKGSHYATFPEEIPRRVILSMCPQSVCRVCWEPRRRITERESLGFGFRKSGENLHDQPVSTLSPDNAVVTTIGWTDCGHGDWRPGVVLDPFAGSGTSGFMAFGNGRSAVLIDLDERNLALARERIGPLFFEEWA